MSRQIRSFVCGLGLAFGTVLASIASAGTQTLPARVVPALAAGGALTLFAVSSRLGLGVRSASAGSLLSGCALGTAAAVGWLALDQPLGWGAGGGLAIGLLVTLGERRGQPHRVPLHRPLLAALIASLAMIGVLLRWSWAQPYAGPPWYGPCLAAGAGFTALAAGTLAGGWLRRRTGIDRYSNLRTPIVLGGLGGLIAVSLPVDPELARSFAVQIQDKSITFGQFLVGVGLIDLRILGPPALVCGILLGILYHAGRSHPHPLASIFVPVAVATVVPAIVPTHTLRLLAPRGREIPWTGLAAPTTPAWSPPARRDADQIAELVHRMSPDAEEPLLVVGWWGPDLSGRLRGKGHRLTIEVIGGAALGERLAAAGANALFRTVIFGPPSHHLEVGSTALDRELLDRMKRQIKPGGHLIVIEHLGRIRTRGIAALLALLQDVAGSAQAWIAGESLVAVGGPPTRERPLLEQALHRAAGPPPWLVLDSVTAHRFIEASRTAIRTTPLFLELPRWQRRLGPWDPLLAARNIKVLVGASDWPAGPLPGRRDQVSRRLLAGRYVLTITAARLEMDQRREQRLLTLARTSFPGDQELEELARTHGPHYLELGRRAREALEKDRTDAAAHLVAGRLALARGAWTEAKGHLTGGAIKWRKNLVDAYPVAADILEDHGHLDWGRDMVRINGLPWAGRHPDVLEAAVRTRAAVGDISGATRCLDELAAKDPLRPGLQRLRGHLAWLDDDPQAGSRHLTLALREDPFDPRIYRELALVMTALGRRLEAGRAESLARLVEGDR